MSPEELKEIVRLHGLHLAGDPAGELANLTEANLTEANLTEANLTEANLTEANLTEANLTEANLTRANLTRANLTRANLTRANLTGASLTRANLTEANLTEANLTGASLIGTGVLAFQSAHYHGYTVPGENGRILQFGCVRLTLDEWDKQARELAEEHEPDRADKFERITRLWVQMSRGLDLP